MRGERILIVDDDQNIRDMLTLYLEKSGYNIDIAKDGHQALLKVNTFRPHLILIDIEIPVLNGFELCKQIRSRLTIPIIFLSERKHIVDKIKGFNLGADDYLTKPFELKELKARIQANLRLYHANPKKQFNVIKYGDLEIHVDQYKCYIDGQLVNLSKKEMNLLIHFAQNPNRVWSPEQLYDQLWPLDATGNVNTVKVHMSTLRRKIETDPTHPKYIKTIRGFGYLLTEEGAKKLP